MSQHIVLIKLKQGQGGGTGIQVFVLLATDPVWSLEQSISGGFPLNQQEWPMSQEPGVIPKQYQVWPKPCPNQENN